VTAWNPVVCHDLWPRRSGQPRRIPDVYSCSDAFWAEVTGMIRKIRLPSSLGRDRSRGAPSLATEVSTSPARYRMAPSAYVLMMGVSRRTNLYPLDVSAFGRVTPAVTNVSEPPTLHDMNARDRGPRRRNAVVPGPLPTRPSRLHREGVGESSPRRLLWNTRQTHTSKIRPWPCPAGAERDCEEVVLNPNTRNPRS